jgi:hypothetical protein
MKVVALYPRLESKVECKEKAWRKQRQAQQIIGREAETATFLKTLLVKPYLVWLPFPPTSSQPLARFVFPVCRMFEKL